MKLYNVRASFVYICELFCCQKWFLFVLSYIPSQKCHHDREERKIVPVVVSDHLRYFKHPAGSLAPSAMNSSCPARCYPFSLYEVDKMCPQLYSKHQLFAQRQTEARVTKVAPAPVIRSCLQSWGRTSGCWGSYIWRTYAPWNFDALTEQAMLPLTTLDMKDCSSALLW